MLPPFRLYILLGERTLRTPINFLENILQAAAFVDARLGGSRALPGILPERGITIGGLLHHHACLWSDV
jgi:hypothetical protein